MDQWQSATMLALGWGEDLEEDLRRLVPELADLNSDATDAEMGQIGPVGHKYEDIQPSIQVKTEVECFPVPVEISLPTPVTRSEGKKLRKYEMIDSNDPTVKNAKLAKMNRDRKKREFAELKEVNEKLKSNINQLNAQCQTERDHRIQAQEALRQQREKNEFASGLSSQCSNLKDILEGVVEGLNRKFRRPLAVQLDSRFSSIPVTPVESSGRVPVPRRQVETLPSVRMSNFGFDLPREYQMGSDESGEIRELFEG